MIREPCRPAIPSAPGRRLATVRDINTATVPNERREDEVALGALQLYEQPELIFACVHYLPLDEGGPN